MNANDNNMLDITLFGRDYRVACKPDERESLLAAVDYVDRKLHDIGEKTDATGERLATMVALNIAHELITLKLPGGFDLPEFRRRIASMQARLDAALEGQEQLF